MKRALGTDLKRLERLAFKRAERSGPILKKFHHNRAKINSNAKSALVWQIYDWICAPYSLWPIDFEGLANHLLKQVENSGKIDPDVIQLAELVGPAPNEETSSAVADFEHVVESGNYDHLVKSPEKFAENDMAIKSDLRLKRAWDTIKTRWKTHLNPNSRGVIRRRLSQERNMRGDWFFDWADDRKKFEIFFDAMCYRWKLYGMQNDEPLLLKISVNPTPHGTMIVIPRHWSLDPGRDLHWNKINQVHKAHGAVRQGRKLSQNRIQTLKDAHRVEKLWNETKNLRIKGDDRYDYVHKKMNRTLLTDHSWVNRLLRIARKKSSGGPTGLGGSGTTKKHRD